MDGARKRTRTSTTVKSQASETCASASSAIRARMLRVKPQPRRDSSSNEAFSLCPPPSALSTKAAMSFCAGSEVDVGQMQSGS